ncbi:MAG: hypothetical protein JWQ23_1740 [Herminiimonas sp.]|nr:hypothetical protein [Herminiimonas sp.]
MDFRVTRYSTDPSRPRPDFPVDAPSAIASDNVLAEPQRVEQAPSQPEQELKQAIERWHASRHRAKDAVDTVFNQLDANLPSRILNLDLLQDSRQFHNMPDDVWKAYGKYAESSGKRVRTVILPAGISRIPAGARRLKLKQLMLSKFPGTELDLRQLNGNNGSPLRVLIFEPLRLETVRMHVNTVIEVFGGDREITLDVQK